jgi:hypothetical protein
MPKIVATKITETKNYIKGQFKLSDKTITKFEIEKKSGAWEQWGNSTNNLCITVECVNKLAIKSLSY